MIMYCPNCGLEENQNTQFCRSCGTDLAAVRTAAVNPQSVDNSTAAIKNEVANAIKRKIESIDSPKQLRKTVEKVLPEVDKLLETPRERRLRRIRSGSLVAMIGLGAAVGFFVAALFGDPEIIVLSAFGFVAMCVGIALVLNGYFFSESDDMPVNIAAGEQDRFPETGRDTNELLMPPPARSRFSSVTENTTRTLDEKLPVPREKNHG